MTTKQKRIIEAVKRTAKASGFKLEEWLLACESTFVIEQIADQAKWMRENNKWQEFEDAICDPIVDVKIREVV